jgi:hypothetical protein
MKLEKKAISSDLLLIFGTSPFIKKYNRNGIINGEKIFAFMASVKFKFKI